jgi:hypothetical protein
MFGKYNGFAEGEDFCVHVFSSYYKIQSEDFGHANEEWHDQNILNCHTGQACCCKLWATIRHIY